MALLFAQAEFDQRLARLRRRMADARVDLALFDEIEAMTWLCGYGNSENRWRCLLVPREGEPFFLIRALDAAPLRERSYLTDITTFVDWEDPLPKLAARIAARGFDRGTIGLDLNSYCMTVNRFEGLKRALPQARFVDLGPVAWELRLLKSEAEVALLRKASAIADEAMRQSVAACRAGGTKRDAVAKAAEVYIKLGADPSHVGPITSGRGWDFLHKALDDATLGPGDVVHLELVPRVQGYCARLMRCAVIGRAGDAQKRAADRLAAIQDAQIAAMVPGARAADVDALARGPILAEKLRDSFDNISGYTLGLYAQMGPRTSDFTRIFHPRAEWRLEPGMVFHMYLSAQGVSFSETVLVGANGPERLTRLERKLFESV